MKLGLVVNNVLTEKFDHTTTLIALTAMNMGHEVWYIGLEKLSYGNDDMVYAKARRLPEHKYNSVSTFIRALQSEIAIEDHITIDKLDILWLRNDPADDVVTRPWARLAGIHFGRLAMRHGVLVLNDPKGLNEADNKMYLQYFPEEIRPRTIITRNPDDIKHFVHQEGGYAVLKPLSGSGGHNVFLIQPAEKANLNQIIEAISREGYIIAQEYLHQAVKGDTRLFLLNGEPLRCKNKIAAIHRAPGSDEDMRSNITAGAVGIKADVTPNMLEVAEIVRSRLVQDGMFFVGLDLVGNKLLEINVFSPGGLLECEPLENAKFCREVIFSLERKVEYIRQHNRNFDNIEVAML